MRSKFNEVYSKIILECNSKKIINEDFRKWFKNTLFHPTKKGKNKTMKKTIATWLNANHFYMSKKYSNIFFAKLKNGLKMQFAFNKNAWNDPQATKIPYSIYVYNNNGDELALGDNNGTIKHSYTEDDIKKELSEKLDVALEAGEDSSKIFTTKEKENEKIEQQQNKKDLKKAAKAQALNKKKQEEENTESLPEEELPDNTPTTPKTPEPESPADTSTDQPTATETPQPEPSDNTTTDNTSTDQPTATEMQSSTPITKGEEKQEGEEKEKTLVTRSKITVGLNVSPEQLEECNKILNKLNNFNLNDITVDNFPPKLPILEQKQIQCLKFSENIILKMQNTFEKLKNLIPKIEEKYKGKKISEENRNTFFSILNSYKSFIKTFEELQSAKKTAAGTNDSEHKEENEAKPRRPIRLKPLNS